ncbi:MAG: MarR family winged helix-turn-helix transcriptional regulator [Sphingomonas fennica]
MAIPKQPLALKQYMPFFWSAISNRWTSSSSRLYLGQYGVGIGEWRVLATLGAQGSATSLDVVKLVGMDPGAVSRAMRDLESKGYVVPVQGRFVGRNKPYEMTDAGVALFDRLRVTATARADRLLDGLTRDEQQTLLTLLQRVHANLAKLDQEVAEAT